MFSNRTHSEFRKSYICRAVFGNFATIINYINFNELVKVSTTNKTFSVHLSSIVFSYLSTHVYYLQESVLISLKQLLIYAKENNYNKILFRYVYLYLILLC